ncbi:MAG: hypothetical protein R6W82_00150 [bacterium]
MGLSQRRRKQMLRILEQTEERTGWPRPAPGLLAAPGREDLTGVPGGLVFDIDGVLIDTHKSFREVIPQAVNFYLEVILAEDGTAPLMRAEDVEAYKRAGGFNNDWDVAEAGLIFSLWWGRHPETAPPLERFSEAMAAAGGGPEAARQVLRVRGEGDTAREVLEDVDRTTLERIFKELYVGGARFREVFGEEPRFYRGTGGMERERPLVGGARWEEARRGPLGILTGRIPQEARLALEMLGIEEGTDGERIVTDDGTFPPKPAPEGLMHIVETMPGRPVYYFGDNRDDLTALVRTREDLGDGGLRFVYCLSGGGDPDSAVWAAEEGADLLAVEVMDVLELLPT